MTTVNEFAGGEGRPDGVVCIAEHDTVVTAAKRMQENNIGCVVVTHDDGRLAGIITERDLINRVLAAEADPFGTTVREYMTVAVVTCTPDTPVNQVQRLMKHHHIRHVTVVEGDRPVGMVSAREIIARRLIEDREMRNLAIFSLAKLAESRDPETGVHLERVREFTRVLGEHMARQDGAPGEIDEEFVQLLYVTSPLHDIGKVAIPDCILLKPGRLDDGEYEIMKSHSERGAETLDTALRQFPQAEFLRMARDIAACHHERMDGQGYPRGLRGEEIPLAARIFAIADVYDALVSKRVYKEAFTHAAARNIILEAAGTQFDERAVSAFVACEDELFAIGQGLGRPRAAA